MNNLSEKNIKCIQKVDLSIASEIVRICKKHGIKYFLEGGTLLGAIRHNGFIPWDEDFDIGMLRDDYERFIVIAKSELSNDYYLQTNQNEKYYGCVFAKVRKKNTIYKEEKSPINLCRNGIFVDIFPYDKFPDNKIKQLFQGTTINILKRVLLAKCGHRPYLYNGKVNFKKFTIYLIAKLLSIFFSKNKLIIMYDTIAKKYNNYNYKYVFSNGIYNYGKCVFNIDGISKTFSHSFENTKFEVPIGYEEILTKVYNDYKKLPPENERYNRHGILELKL